MARDFSGGAGYKLQVSSSPSEFGIGGLGAFSTSFWVKPLSYGSFQYVAQFKGTAGPQVNEYYCQNSAPHLWRMGARIGGSGGANGVDGDANVPTGVWTLLTFTYDGTNRRAYYNGIEDTSDGPLAASGTLLTLDSTGYIGNNSSGNKNLDADLADLCTWDRVLTVPEMMYLVGGGSPATLGPVMWVPITGDHSPEIDFGPDHLSWTVTGATKTNDPPRTLFPHWRPAQTRAVAGGAALAGTITGTSSVTDAHLDTDETLEGTIVGTSSVPTAALDLDKLLGGTLTGSSSVPTAALSLDRALAGTITGTSSTLDAVLDLDRALAGTLVGTSSVTDAHLDADEALAGTLVGTSSVTDAHLDADEALAGTLVGTSSASADLEIAAIAVLSGTIVGTSSVLSAALDLDEALSATVLGTSSVLSSVLDVNAVLSGAIVGTSSVSADLEVGGGVAVLAGTIVGVSNVPNVVLGAESLISGTVVGGATVPLGDLTLYKALSGLLIGSSSVNTPALDVDWALSGEIVGTSAVLSAAMALELLISGGIVGISQVSAGMSLEVLIAGSILGTSTVSGNIFDANTVSRIRLRSPVTLKDILLSS